MKTDLIYGIEDRPPFKDALFAALQHLLAIFVAIITPPYRQCLETGCGENRFLGFDVSLCFGGIYFYPVSPFWTYRGKVALYSGNKFFVYRSYHCYGTCRWTSSYFWCLYGGCSH